MKKGNRMAMGIAMGIAFGTAVRVVTDNLVLWLGAGVGNSMQKKADNENDGNS